jgi:hypothetical protein
MSTRRCFDAAVGAARRPDAVHTRPASGFSGTWLLRCLWLAAALQVSISLSVSDVPPPTVAAGDDNRHLLCQLAIEIPL